MDSGSGVTGFYDGFIGFGRVLQQLDKAFIKGLTGFIPVSSGVNRITFCFHPSILQTSILQDLEIVKVR